MACGSRHWDKLDMGPWSNVNIKRQKTPLDYVYSFQFIDRMFNAPSALSSSYFADKYDDDYEDSDEDKEEEEEEKKREVMEAEVPPETRDEFTPPELPTPYLRAKKYGLLGKIPVPSAAFFVINDVPFFESFNHKKAMLGLQSFRKAFHIPIIFLRSIRPHFPFFFKD